MSESSEPTSQPKVQVFHPLLFAAYPILSIYSANLALVPAQAVLRPLAFIVVVVTVIWFLSGLILRSSERGAMLSSTLVLTCFLYSRAVSSVNLPTYLDDARPLIWGGFMIILAGFSAWKISSHKLLNILSLTLVLAALGQISFGVFQSAALRPDTHHGQDNSAKIFAVRPDITYIILDGFGRSDALQRALNYSSEPFVEGLEKRGFFVAKDSHANYCQTELSVGSSLNMEFIQQLLPKVPLNAKDRSPLDTIIDDNRVAQYLKDRGYVFSAITTGFPPLQFEHADVNLQSQAGLNLMESALVQMTPFGATKLLQTSLFDLRRKNLNAAFAALESLSTRALKPRFTIVHILAPHPPFVFGPHGESLPRKCSYGFWDGSDFLSHVSPAKDYRDGYTGQAEYIANRTLAALDVLLAGPGEKPIIFVQGDHGSKLRLDQNSLAKTDINECFPNLSAFLVPDSIRTHLYNGITPVNSFRILFNELFDAKLDMKQDRSWYSTFPEPYRFSEVTSQIADHSKMPSVPFPR